VDSTELHYLTYDPDEIWKEMLINYVEAGGEVMYPGDEKEMLLKGVLADIVQVFAGVDNALRMMTLRYAVGEYLDIIGELRSCPRIDASAALATVTIVTNQTGKTGTLPAGTAMTADGERFYMLVQDLALTGYQQTVTMEIVADRAGSAGNGLLAGSQMALAVTNEAINSIVVATDASGGNEAEDDETYRERIRAFMLASVSTGPAQQYEAAAKAVSSDIVDARALNLGAGQVGIYLLLSTSTGVSAILQSVADALSGDDTRPMTDQVSVYQATDVTYTLNISYTADGSSATNAAIASAVEEYQRWQDNVIGRAFNPDRLLALLYQAGVTRALYGNGSVFGSDGEIEYTEIEANERCKGTITLTSM